MKTFMENDIVVIEVVLPGLAEKLDEFRETIGKYRAEGRRKFLLQVLGGDGFTSLDLGSLISLAAKTIKAGGVVAVYTDEELIQVVLFIESLGGPPPWLHRDRDAAIKYLKSTDPGEDPHH